MMPLRRILCATDFSAPSLPAWEFAQRLARATDARLLLVHVVPIPWIPMPLEGAFIDPLTSQRLVDDSRREARERLDRLVHDAGDLGARVSVQVDDGPAAPRILAVNEREDADLIVVGTHGRTGLNRLLMGSVAERVLQLAKRPVVTVRPGTAGGSNRAFTRILYATDFSPLAERAWPWARRLAQLTGASVDVLHVRLEVVPDRHADPASFAQMVQVMREAARMGADRFRTGGGLPPDRVAMHVVDGVEADQIAHWASSHGADLIVIGTHGRTGVLRLALGSVARRVLHAAACPVLTVGPEVGG